MNLYRLFVKASWEQVRSVYLSAHPGEKSILPDIRRVYSRLLEMPVEASDIVLTYMPELGEDGVARLRLTGLDGIARKSPVVLPLVPWGEWPGMEVDGAIPSDDCAAEILADCLYEMTRLGVSEYDAHVNAFSVKVAVQRMMVDLRRRRGMFWSRNFGWRHPGLLSFYDEIAGDD